MDYGNVTKVCDPCDFIRISVLPVSEILPKYDESLYMIKLKF